MKMMVVDQQVEGMPAKFIYFDGSGKFWECTGEMITKDCRDQTIDCQVVTPQHAYHIILGGGHSELEDLKAFIECLLETDPRSMKL